MPVQVQSLGSGSSGNALLIETTTQSFVIDCGIGPRALKTALAAYGRDLSTITALFLSHEHSDHVRSLGSFERAAVPIIATTGTARAADVAKHLWQEIRPESPIRIGKAEITALPVQHDAAEPCGYVFTIEESRIVVLTDLGCATESLREAVGAADLVVIEANHDEQMLRRGPYPAYLKQRVLSPQGHLSNVACADFLVDAFAGSAHIRTVWLAHLSQTNNRPGLATTAVEAALAAHGHAFPVSALPRTRRGPVWQPGAVSLPPRQLPLL